VIYAGYGHPQMARIQKSTPRFLKDTSKKDIVTRAGRLGGRRYNRFSLQVESAYSDYLRVVILGNAHIRLIISTRWQFLFHPFSSRPRGHWVDFFPPVGGFLL
jgi:hypothetical protein